MGKSLSETAKSILMNEGAYPSVSPDQNGTFDRDAKSSTTAKSSLRPHSGSVDPDPKHNEASDLGGATPTSTYKDNIGAKAAVKAKDSSRSAKSAVPAEAPKKLSEEDIEEGDVMEEEIEMTEELEAFIAELSEQGLTEEEIAQAIEENFELVSEEAEEELEEEYEDEEESSRVDMKEHVDALLAGEELSEEFRAKAETIFESAVNVRVNEEVTVLEEAYAQALTEEVEKIKSELAEQVDDYLNYVVENWISANEVAIDTGLRSELTEDFISGLRNLFAEHYIDIPEEKVQVVEQLGAKVEELEAKLNESIEQNVNLTKQINESKQFEVFINACDGLTTTQAERLKALAENVEFTSIDEYQSKVETLREAYFSTSVNSDHVIDSYETDAGMITEETTGRMSAYVKALPKVKK